MLVSGRVGDIEQRKRHVLCQVSRVDPILQNLSSMREEEVEGITLPEV